MISFTACLSYNASGRGAIPCISAANNPLAAIAVRQCSSAALPLPAMSAHLLEPKVAQEAHTPVVRLHMAMSQHVHVREKDSV